MNSKFLKITLIMAILVFVSVGYLFLSGKTGQKEESTGKVANNTVSTTETKNWKTYKNEKYGFEMKYPAEWKTVREEKDGHNFVSVSFWKQNLKQKDAEDGMFFVSISPNNELDKPFNDILINETIETLGLKVLKKDKLQGHNFYVVRNQDPNPYNTETCFYMDGKLNSVCVNAQTLGVDGANQDGVINKEVYNQILSSFKFTE